MTAGRELDALVAEKVMEWGPGKIQQGARERRPAPYFGMWNDQVLVYLPEDGGCSSFYFAPTTDIRDAWKVVEALRKRGIYIDVGANIIGYAALAGWEGEAGDDIWKNTPALQADTAPLAICRAALAAVGAEVSA